jgi:hypothetical protein
MVWGIRILLVLPVAAVTGSFAGWCLGASGGEWLEYFGAANATAWSGQVGGLLGAILCPAYVLRRVIRDERASARAPSETRDGSAI